MRRISIDRLAPVAPSYTSSPTATVTEPEVAPLAIVIVEPLDSVTVTASCAALPTDAVYVI